MNNLGGRLRHYDWLGLLRQHFLIILVALLFSWAYMGQSLTSCQTHLVSGGTGDHLSGIIWLFTNTPHPYGGVSHVTNYPFGENTAQPQLITSAIYMVPAWLISKAVGPFCAWNSMVFFGYMSSAILMYAFIYWLLKRRSIAIYAAIAVAFTPYHYWKTYGHLSYIQSELFIALLWTFVAFWRRPTRKKAVLLGILAAGLLYGDGYYPLIGGLLLGSIGAYSIVLGYFSSQAKKTDRSLYISKVKYLLLSLAILLLSALPILFVDYHYKSKINSALAANRSNERSELETYGARPRDYLLPSQTSPFRFVSKWVTTERNRQPYSNVGEYTLFLGYTTMLLALGAAAFALIKLRQRTKLKELDSWLIWVIGACGFTALVAIATSFAPSVTVFGFRPEWPAAIIGHFTSLWRVFARIYLVVNIAVVTMASIGLYYLASKFKSSLARGLVIALVIILTLLELAPVNPIGRHDVWSTSNASPTYWWLRGQKQIKAIAAYPLLEQPFDSTYFGDQVIYKKPMLDSYLATDPEMMLHRSLAGLEDNQTLGVLKTLGINDLLLYRINIPASDSRLSILYGNYGAKVARISSSVTPLNHVLVPDTSYAQPTVDESTQISCRQQLAPAGTLTVRNLKGPKNISIPVHFELKGQPGQSVVITLSGKAYDKYKFQSPNEIRALDLTMPVDSVLRISHTSSASKGYVAVCNLGVSS